MARGANGALAQGAETERHLCLAPMPDPVPARWSQEVSRRSHALDLEPGVFTLADPAAVAVSLKRSAEASTLRKASAFGSAMAMLNFYINRAGRGLPHERRAVLEAAKDELRAMFGRPRKGVPMP